jgi:RecB family exonuclease
VPEYLEQPFRIAVDGWTLRGVIDRIDHGETAWQIIDYKSGRPISRSRHDLQVALYALGATSALQLEPVDLQVVYLATGETVAVERAGALVAEAKQQGTEVAEGVMAGRFESRPERRRCRLCPYRLACADAL